MQHSLCKRVYIAIYAYLQVIYAYMEPRKHIFRSYIYIYIYIYIPCLFVDFHIFCMLNICKWVQMSEYLCSTAHQFPPMVAYMHFLCKSCMAHHWKHIQVSSRLLTFCLLTYSYQITVIQWLSLFADVMCIYILRI